LDDVPDVDDMANPLEGDDLDEIAVHDASFRSWR
jgi:hypothetical protein